MKQAVELPYTFPGAVLPGDGIGRKIGVPTLNIETAWIDKNLEHGIYAGAVILPDGTDYPAAIHYGPRPAFDDASIRLEAHLIDASLAETPSEATVIFMSFLRPIRHFADTKSLKKAIEDDIKKVRGIMASR